MDLYSRTATAAILDEPAKLDLGVLDGTMTKVCVWLCKCECESNTVWESVIYEVMNEQSSIGLCLNVSIDVEVVYMSLWNYSSTYMCIEKYVYVYVNIVILNPISG